jgi:transcriptional regulator with XRE-family HTH domain
VSTTAEGPRKRPLEPVTRMEATRQFAENLRYHRRRRGLSQERLAAASGLHRTEISLLERCEREPRLSTIIRLARGLGLPPDALLERIE